MSETKIPVGKIIAGLAYFLGFPALLLLIGGDIRWWQAWVYIGIALFSTILSRVLMAKAHPDLIKERAKFGDERNTERWDKFLGPMVALWLPLLYFVVAGLDHRFELSPELPLWVNLSAILVIVCGYAFATWAMVENSFFSANVRIQTDRDQQVIKSGPYAIVRHPGYAGGLIVALLFPLVLNTLWAFLPVAVFFSLVVLRTAKEDATLTAKLPGYIEYTQQTRYRLFPGMW